MIEMRIPIEEFDLENFVDHIAYFIAGMEENPSHGLACIDRFGGVAVYEFGPGTRTEIFSILNENKGAVFFPFTYSDDEFLICADRIEYSLFFSEDYDQVEKFIDPTDSVGYLLKVEDGTMLVNSAIRASRRIDLCPDCGFLESPLERFILDFKYEKGVIGQECVDCGCTEGELHEFGCENERCPFCGEHLIACDCRYEILGLIDRSKYGPATSF